ncbi:hypothetical protein HDU67_003590, partial [Dinochytrium kinnereticum]
MTQALWEPLNKRLFPMDMNISQNSFSGPYEILQHLGTGGFGLVFLGLDRTQNTYVAIKVIKKEAGYVAGPHPEAVLMAAVAHPRVVRLIEAFDTSDKICWRQHAEGITRYNLLLRLEIHFRSLYLFAARTQVSIFSLIEKR